MPFEALESWVNQIGVAPLLLASGLVVGFVFGFMAQRSQFCLRAAVIEFSTGHMGERLSIWLLTFASALLGVQALIAFGGLQVDQSRAMTATGSLSGAALGGISFGIGMVLARGCASRLLILSGSGNARALLAGLIFVVSAQAAYQGLLAPLRLTVSELWTVPGGPDRDLLARIGWPPASGLVLGLAVAAIATIFAIHSGIRRGKAFAAVGTGGAVVLAYLLTYQIGLAELDPTALRGITFSGPSADWLMRILGGVSRPLGFDGGLIPGVFLGAALASVLAGEWRLQVFDAQSGTVRYLIGAVLMGFGSMTAGGCAVGAGVTGGAIFSLTAWIALSGMWLGAGVTHWLLDQHRTPAALAAKAG